jgi:hypothetical protein
MVLINGTIARFDVSVLTALLPPIDASTQVVQPILFGADDNDPNVLYHYSMTAHAGQWIAVHLAKTSTDAGYLFVNVYGGIRGGVGMTLVHAYLVQQSTAVIRIPCPAEFLRIDVVATGGDSSTVDCALYVQGVA